MFEAPEYIAVCAARNEEKFIAYSLDSVLNQTIPPRICILSDDCSNDDTPIIAEELGIKVILNKRKRYRMGAFNQVLALNYGIKKATDEIPDWEFLLKFDADTIIPINYVETIIRKMTINPRIGICSGKPMNEKMRLARASDAAKIYRRQCWEDIKGLDMRITFDTHAIIKAAQAGWESRTLNPLTFKELRPSGKYELRRWMLAGFERASFGFPLYHTILASIKNVRWGSPPILNGVITILAHIINPFPKDPYLDNEWVKKYAINEVRFFIKEVCKSKEI